MKTARERLDFAFRFANQDLDHMRPGDLLNLREDLGNFHWGLGGEATSLAERGGISATLIDPPFPQDFSVDDFKRLQADITSLLRAVSLGGRRALGPGDKPRSSSVPTFTLTARYMIVPLPGLSFIGAQGGTHDITLLMLIHLLTRDHPSRFRTCPDPDCGRLFYRVRRQLFCSKRCVARANKREERRRPAEKRLSHAKNASRAKRPKK